MRKNEEGKTAERKTEGAQDKDPEDVKMQEQADFRDKSIEAEVKRAIEEAEKVSPFKKLLQHNKPCFLIFTGVICAIATGVYQPISGLILSELLTYMTAPFTYLGLLALQDDDFKITDAKNAGQEYLEYNIKFYSIAMGVVAVACMFSSFIQKLSFGILGENTTYAVR